MFQVRNAQFKTCLNKNGGPKTEIFRRAESRFCTVISDEVDVIQVDWKRKSVCIISYPVKTSLVCFYIFGMSYLLNWSSIITKGFIDSTNY